MDKPVIYLSGPISKVPGGNKETFIDAQRVLEERGFEVLNPHQICAEIKRDWFQSEKEFWNACMRACLKSMMDAELIMMLPGFSNSDGASLELENARRLDFKVLYYADWYKEIQPM